MKSRILDRMLKKAVPGLSNDLPLSKVASPPRDARRLPKKRVFRWSVKLALTGLLVMSGTQVAMAAKLSETVRQALERHPEYPLHTALREVGEGYRRQAGSLFGGDPSLDLSLAGDALGSDEGFQEYIIGLSAPIALPAQRAARREIARGFDSRAASALARLNWEVAGEVLERAWRVRIADAGARQAMKQWAAARALEKDIQHRFDVGELARNDLLLARQDAVEREAAYREAQGEQRRARLAWRQYTGQDELPSDLSAYARPVETRPLHEHPRLREVLDAVRLAQARLGDARQQRRAPPVVSLAAKRDRDARGEAYDNSLGLSLSLPFGSRAQAAPAIAEAGAGLTRAEIDAAAQRRDLELRIAEADEHLADAQRLWVLAGKKQRYASDRLKLAQRAFELGEMGLYPLLLARQQAATAARDLELRRLEKQRAQARKNHLTGVMPR